MPGPAAARIDEVGVAPVRLSHRQPEPGVVLRRQDQVDVVGHEAIGPDLDTPAPDLFRQKIAVDLLVAVLKENRLAPVSTLGDVVGQSGNNDASETGHASL